jgi:hypothetical protein
MKPQVKTRKDQTQAQMRPNEIQAKAIAKSMAKKKTKAKNFSQAKNMAQTKSKDKAKAKS